MEGRKQCRHCGWMAKAFLRCIQKDPSESPLVCPSCVCLATTGGDSAQMSHHGADRGVGEVELPSDVSGMILLQETNRQTKRARG